MKKIVLAFDAFKGSLTSDEIVTYLQDYLPRYYKDINILSFPIADGGEGTSSIIGKKMQAKTVACLVHNALMEQIMATYMITSDGTAIIEMAMAAGLPLIPREKRNPLLTTTFGVGEMIMDALEHGCRHFILGLGGSATNDAGIGILKALKGSFKDSNGVDLAPIGYNLKEISYIDMTQMVPEINESTFELICDVTNPFCGPQGAAYMYAPQKGAGEQMVKDLDEGMRHYANILLEQTDCDISNISGAGAAGGVAGGLLPFLNVKLKSGIEYVLDVLHFDELVSDADLIIAGEGKIDTQTGMGKALCGVLKVAQKHKIPVVALAGSVDNVDMLNNMGFTSVLSIQHGPITLQQAMQKKTALRNILEVVIQVLNLYFYNKK